MRGNVVVVKGAVGSGKTYYVVYNLLQNPSFRGKTLITNLKIDGFECVNPDTLSAGSLSILEKEGYIVFLDDIARVKWTDPRLEERAIRRAITSFITASVEDDLERFIPFANRTVNALGKKRSGDTEVLEYKEQTVGKKEKLVILPVLDEVFDAILDDYGLTREQRKKLRERGVVTIRRDDI